MGVEHREISGKQLYIVDNVLTSDECADIIRRAEESGYLARAPDVRSSYHRAVFADSHILERLLYAITPHLPDSLVGCAVIGDEVRYNKYNAGDFIAIHLDGINMSRRMQNALTVNVYLNDGFGGGETVFYDDERNEVLRIAPRVGCAVLFEPNIYHAGAVVTAGEKKIMRACVYRAAGATSR
jgi:Rps23 Pro-64 3,4-dihydroxylase Tpa1-like proline 4-hydroxylase